MNVSNLLKKGISLFCFFPVVIWTLDIIHVICLFFISLGKTAKFNFVAFRLISLALAICAVYFSFQVIWRYKSGLLSVQNLKSIGFKDGLFILAFMMLGLWTLFAKSNARLWFAVTCALFLILGIGHFYAAYRRNLELNHYWQDAGRIWSIGGLAFMATIFSIAFSRSIQTQLPMAYYSSFATFLVPPFTYWSYVLWSRIPDPYPEAWYFDPYPALPPIPPLPTYSCIFKIEGKDYLIRPPVTYLLGHAMQKFLIQSANDGLGIKYYQENNKGEKQYYGWHFLARIEGSSGKRYLDPSLSFLHNKIDKGTTIFADRVK